MALLIPDSRRNLFSGLVDDARLLGNRRMSVEDAVERHRALRSGGTGWIAGRFVVPASTLENLAGALVRTMATGEAPWRIAAVFGDDPARDASIAASFHAAMDPAASIDVIRVPWNRDRPAEDVATSLAAAHGVHPDVLPVLDTDVGHHPEAVLDVIARTRAVTLRPAGVDINLGTRHDPVSLLEMMDRCARDGVPFTIGPDSRTAVTATDPSSSTPRYGVMNLVGAMLVGSGRRHDERMELLLDEDPDSFEIGFAGMRWRGAPVGSGTSLGDGRDPLLSIGSVDPDDAILAIGEIISTG